MQKVCMCNMDLEEKYVEIEDIKLKNGKFYINSEQHLLVYGSNHILEIFYMGVKKALNGEITEATADEFLKALK